MAEKAESLKLDYYIDLILRHRWFIIIPFCLSMIVGLYFALVLPKIYVARTLILVESQRVPEKFVQSIVSTDVDSKISTISQQIKSRSNLEKIIKKVDLFPTSEFKNTFMEEKVEALRERINVRVTRSRGRGADTFSISLTGSDPQKIMRAVNEVASGFIDENLKVREDQAVGTSVFLESQLESIRKRLEEVEKKLRDYRKLYMGELPEQLDTNLRILDRLQNDLNERQKGLQDARNRLMLINNQIETNKQFLAATTTTQTDNGEVLDINQLRNQLANLKASYTDRHPDVIRLKDKIKDLEAKPRLGETGQAATSPSNPSQNRTPSVTNSFAVAQIRQQQEIEMEIRNLDAEIPQLKRQIREYQRRVEATPKREEELLALKRDYNNIQGSYSSLLNRKLEADIAVSMEKKQKGEQFRIIDYAQVPNVPVSPNMKKLFMMAVAAGLGLGGGLIFLLDFFDTSLRRIEDIESDLGVAVIATIPRIYQQKDKVLQRINMVLTAFGVLIAICLFSGFGLLVLKGVDPVIELVQQYTNMPVKDFFLKLGF
jgi:polysaccharide chain length determinant protein (PEP-CTERM system associated)